MPKAEAPINREPPAEALYLPDDSNNNLSRVMSYRNNGHWSMVPQWRYG